MRVEYYKRCVGLASDATLQGGPLAAASSTPLAAAPALLRAPLVQVGC